jgi:large subunit ribosomal protein L15
MNLHPPIRSLKKRKIVGRGQGTGNGCTAGRGNNGQKSRSGFSRQLGFEGGQMPLARRIPKRGFNNTKFEKTYQAVNIQDLNRFNDGEEVGYEALLKMGLISKKSRFVKLLAKGELTKKLTIRVHRASDSAKEAVEKANGTLEIIS